ncbi:hypothetical protein IT575_08495 [bacterium]|nr:hypothetical protein [bacterium]
MLNRRPSSEAQSDPRLILVYVVVALIFVAILVRLVVLQVLNRDSLRLKSIGNVITTIQTPALRGEILDRQGTPLAENRNDLKLLYTPPPGIDQYFPLPADKARAKAKGAEPYYYLRRYAYSPIRSGAEALGLSYIEMMSRLERELAFPAHAPAVVVADTLSAANLSRWENPEKQELLRRLGYSLEQGTDGQHRLFFTPEGDPARYFPSPAEKLRFEQQGRDYHYMDFDVAEETLRRHPAVVQGLSGLARYLNVSYASLMTRVEKENIRVGRPPYTIVDKLAFPQVVYISENSSAFEGVMIDEYSFNRAYSLGAASGHLLGYTGLMSKEERSSGAFPYPLTDMVGKGGLEKQYEELLHGRAGRRNLKVSKHSSYGTWVSTEEPQRGNNLYLTIDSGLQKEAYRQMNGRPGAVIISALEPGHEGEILAYVSSPGIDPALIKDQEYYDSVSNNPLKPLLNRASGMTYPPGSTFKMVTLTAALTTGVIEPDTHFGCNGFIPFSDIKMHCHHRSGHGDESLLDALADSCDVYLYKAGMALKDPPSDIKRFALLYGYGEQTGIDLPDENRGFLPDAAWRRKRYASPHGNEVDRRWHAGRTCNYAIGQGDMLASPLQVLMSSSVIALNGHWCPPHLLYAKEADRQIVPVAQPPASDRKLDHDVLALMRQGMRAAVVRGTCRMLNLSGMGVCAKSGTAQSHPHKPDHSWVTGYYPEDNPRYAFVVLVEYGGSSTESAIPVMRNILQYMAKHDPLSHDAVQLAGGQNGRLMAGN